MSQDAVVKELAPLKRLTTLWLINTQVAAVGVKEFQKMLPKCKITK